jgi:chemotaxis regulatin CheY-phosphate phosphatase CheZ
MEMIETILYCLPNAFKGTIYQIGKPPHMNAERITSGVIDGEKKKISWGLPARSDYNPPGKAWLNYRDEPERPLEAMAWCVERQRSWTAEDPRHDARSVRLHVDGQYEDYNHMEPVLVREADLNPSGQPSAEYPRKYDGTTIWQETEYVVVAVIKIHFRPDTIRIGGPETRVIKRLSRSLGTELLSYQLRQDSMHAMQQLARDRLSSCNVLADSLRNAITKSGLIFSLVKKEMAYLRDEWEQVLRSELDERDGKKEAIDALNDILGSMKDGAGSLRKELVRVQDRFLDLSLPPEKAMNWIEKQIKTRWHALLQKSPQDDRIAELIWQRVDDLIESLHFGQAPNIIRRYSKIPEDVKAEWVNLIYKNTDRFDATVLERLIKTLENPNLDIPSRRRSRETLTQLKALAETMNQLEENTNCVLTQMLNGGNGAGRPPIPEKESKPETLTALSNTPTTLPSR